MVSDDDKHTLVHLELEEDDLEDEEEVVVEGDALPLTMQERLMRNIVRLRDQDEHKEAKDADEDDGENAFDYVAEENDEERPVPRTLLQVLRDSYDSLASTVSAALGGEDDDEESGNNDN
ncbi:hypothetical protein BGX29_004316 [Mortierella sp. GBA35]|nr:hypothetical protein BGX29_004316 [Mortierella sp. GBA35]